MLIFKVKPETGQRETGSTEGLFTPPPQKKQIRSWSGEGCWLSEACAAAERSFSPHAQTWALRSFSALLFSLQRHIRCCCVWVSASRRKKHPTNTKMDHGFVYHVTPRLCFFTLSSGNVGRCRCPETERTLLRRWTCFFFQLYCSEFTPFTVFCSHVIRKPASFLLYDEQQNKKKRFDIFKLLWAHIC